MTDDIIDTEDAGDTTDQITAAAFAAPPFKWKDITLQPFAIDREGDWLLHRKLVGAPPLGEIIADVGAMTLDAMRVLWFCAHDPADWLAPAADVTSRAQSIETRIREWARLHIEGNEIPASVSLFYEIFNRAHSTRATISGDGKAQSLGN